MTHRYVWYPGPVTCSKSGDSHFVSASTLARLYGIEMRDCVVFDPDPCNREEDYKSCIHLFPHYNDPFVLSSRYGVSKDLHAPFDRLRTGYDTLPSIRYATQDERAVGITTVQGLFA